MNYLIDIIFKEVSNLLNLGCMWVFVSVCACSMCLCGVGKCVNVCVYMCVGVRVVCVYV